MADQPTSNGGYSIDKKWIEEKFKQNEEEHKIIIKDNKQAHDRIEVMLKEVHDKYVPDVISHGIQLKFLIWGVCIIGTTGIGFIVKGLLEHFIAK